MKRLPHDMRRPLCRSWRDICTAVPSHWATVRLLLKLMAELLLRSVSGAGKQQCDWRNCHRRRPCVSSEIPRVINRKGSGKSRCSVRSAKRRNNSNANVQTKESTKWLLKSVRKKQLRQSGKPRKKRKLKQKLLPWKLLSLRMRQMLYLPQPAQQHPPVKLRQSERRLSAFHRGWGLSRPIPTSSKSQTETAYAVVFPIERERFAGLSRILKSNSPDTG